MKENYYEINFPGIHIQIEAETERLEKTVYKARKLLELLQASLKESKSLEEFIDVGDNKKDGKNK